MSQSTAVERHIRLSQSSARRLHQLSEAKAVSEDRIVEKAIDILFSMSGFEEGLGEPGSWSFLSEDSLSRVWDNDQDSTYDNWRETYEIPAR